MHEFRLFVRVDRLLALRPDEHPGLRLGPQIVLFGRHLTDFGYYLRPFFNISGFFNDSIHQAWVPTPVLNVINETKTGPD